MSGLTVILSVDWEPDHGPWKWSQETVDYGGVLKGTPAFCALLDELNIPCTWFVESSYDPERDLPSCFAESVQQIASRPRDEIGLHIHWRRTSQNNTLFYETQDEHWIGAQLDQGVGQLEGLGISPRSFRSGALLHIQQLPRMLAQRSFAVDSSILWGKANRLTPNHEHLLGKSVSSRCRTFVNRALGSLPEPYLTDIRDVELRGNSDIVEFPITYSLFEVTDPLRGGIARYWRWKAFFLGQSPYLAEDQ